MYWVIAAGRTDWFLTFTAALYYGTHLKWCGIDYIITDGCGRPLQ